MRRFWILTLVVSFAVAVLAGSLWFWLGGRGEDILVAGSTGDETAGVTGETDAAGGLFRFGNPYLDGRSRWLKERFRKDREGLEDLAAPSGLEATCTVHRSPFTTGDWVAGLSEQMARHRRETESQAVQSRLLFFVEGVSPGRVLLFLAAADFIERAPGEGKIEYDALFDPAGVPAGELDAVPTLGPGEWLTRQTWKRPLAYPTALYYVNKAFREGETRVLIYEAWRNFGDASHAAVRFGSGQYAIVPRRGGSLVLLTSYFSGQSIPPLMDSFVVSLSESFCRKLARVIQQEAGTWTPAAKAAVWFRKLGLE